MAAMTRPRDEWTPDWATHPGEHVAEHIEARGWSQAELARLAGLSPKLISTIISGANPVSAETAIKLERVLGVKAYIWTGIQARWDLFQLRVRDKAAPEMKSWLSLFPIKELCDRKWISDTRDERVILDALLHLLQIGTPQAYEAKVNALAVRHRRSKAFESAQHHVFTWLMLGEYKARQMNPPAFDAQKFEKAVRIIRNMTTEPPSVFESEMKKLCWNSGVALILEPPISKTCLFGSARWFDSDRAIIQMSLRMKTNDHFWWTFFHEAAHIFLHGGKNFADDQNGKGDDTEEEADRWAEEMLVGRRRFARFKAQQPRSAREIKRFAEEVRLHPGIIVGMLQHARILPHSHLNGLKARFVWRNQSRETARTGA